MFSFANEINDCTRLRTQNRRRRDVRTQVGERHGRLIPEQMIKKLKSGEYRLYARRRNPKTGRRRNLGTFQTLGAAKRHESQVQFFKRRG